MPGRDRTGPSGFGPMTGQRMGFCADNDNLNYSNRGLRYRRENRGSFGFGRGYGRGFRYGTENMNIPNTPHISEKTIIENEMRILKEQLSSLEGQLKRIGEKSDE